MAFASAAYAVDSCPSEKSCGGLLVRQVVGCEGIRRAEPARGIVGEFEGSGLSMAEFCHRRGVGIAPEAWSLAWSSGPGATFGEVEPLRVDGGHGGSTAAAAGSLCAELMLPGGAVMRVYQIHPTGGAA